MSFRQYIATRQARGNPQGDFVRDARADPDMPNVESWAELKRYLYRLQACDAAIDAGRLVWQSYQASLRKDGKELSATSTP